MHIEIKTAEVQRVHKNDSHYEMRHVRRWDFCVISSSHVHLSGDALFRIKGLRKLKRNLPELSRDSRLLAFRRSTKFSDVPLETVKKRNRNIVCPERLQETSCLVYSELSYHGLKCCDRITLCKAALVIVFGKPTVDPHSLFSCLLRLTRTWTKISIDIL